MVGGRDYGVSQFNRVTQAQRQTGSAFKPFVYLTGLDKFTPISKLDNTPRTFMVNGKPWSPSNFEADSPPVVTVREALAHSYNIATVNLAMAIGIDKIAQTARAFDLPVPETPYPAMALGATPMTPLSLARAYCVFAANGVLPYPLSAKVVVNEAGKVLENRHAEIKRLIPPAKAYLISNLLRSVVQEGTGRSLKRLGIDWPVAGKTGTTNDYRDAWFVGYTPDILALVWVGFDDGQSIDATGAQAALPIWADLMRSLPQYVSGQWLTVPPGIVKRRVCLDSGKEANSIFCHHCAEEVFLAGTAPPETCSQHPSTNANSVFFPRH
jgi:penicillin-binding protein 1B